MSLLIEKITKALDNKFKVPRDHAETSKKEFDRLGFRMRSVPLDVHRMARAVAGGKRLSPASATRLGKLIKRIRKSGAETADSRLKLLGGTRLSKQIRGHLKSLKQPKKLAKSEA